MCHPAPGGGRLGGRRRRSSGVGRVHGTSRCADSENSCSTPRRPPLGPGPWGHSAVDLISGGRPITGAPGARSAVRSRSRPGLPAAPPDRHGGRPGSPRRPYRSAPPRPGGSRAMRKGGLRRSWRSSIRRPPGGCRPRRPAGAAATSPVPGPRRSRPSVRTRARRAYARDAKGELFLLAVSNMVGEDAFYERQPSATSGSARWSTGSRSRTSMAGPASSRWLRSEANMRSRPDRRRAGGRQGAAGRRPPKAATGSWSRACCSGPTSPASSSPTGPPVRPCGAEAGQAGRRRRGRAPLQRAALLKYDTTGRASGSATCIELVHPAPGPAAVAGRPVPARARPAARRDDAVPAALPMLRRPGRAAGPAGRRAARRCSRDPERLRAAGMTWEALAGWLQGPMDAALGGGHPVDGLHGAAAQPAQLRRGRASRTRSPQRSRPSWPTRREVARSRQLPFRFLRRTGRRRRCAGRRRWSGR